jgi:hypothetical protein
VRRDALILGVLAALGLALRLRGLDWGLPWALHIDERLFVAAKAIQLERSLAGGALPDPGISSYGILPLWLVVAARQLLLGVAAQPGPPAHGDSFAGTILLARGISALAGTLAIVLAGLWARRFGRATGLLAAALVAGFPALVQAGHFGTVESLLAAGICAGLLAAERVAERPSASRLVAAGVTLGLALSVKAPAALLALPLAHAVLAGDRRRAAGRLAGMLASAAIVVLLLNPGMMLAGGDAGARTGEHTTLAGNLRRAYSRDFHDWTLPYAHDVPGWTELTRLLPYAVGVVPEVLALAGLVVAVRRRAPHHVRLLLFAAPLLALLVAASVKTVRFLVPALPAVAVLAAEGLAALSARAAGRLRAVAAAAVAALSLLHGAAFSSIYAETDSRVAAARWLDRNVGERDIVVVEDPPGYGPPIGSPSSELPRPRLRYEILWNGYYAVHERADEAARRSHVIKVLERADWLALSEGHRASFTAAPELRPVESAFYRHLDEGTLPFEKVAEFKSWPRLGRWILKDDGAEVLFRVFDHPRIEIWRRRGE